jgi:hypothetical protein
MVFDFVGCVELRLCFFLGFLLHLDDCLWTQGMVPGSFRIPIASRRSRFLAFGASGAMRQCGNAQD